jgi:hypothetical protein
LEVSGVSDEEKVSVLEAGSLEESIAGMTAYFLKLPKKTLALALGYIAGYHTAGAAGAIVGAPPEYIKEIVGIAMKKLGVIVVKVEGGGSDERPN